MDLEELRTWVAEAAERESIPGVAVGVWHEGEETYVFHGVTSLENPLPVDEATLFQFGSTGKTYTATAIMRLVERGEIDLNEKVRTYVPELKLKDEDVAREVTVLHLLNHTAGWSGDLMKDTGWGDDALARYVANMAEIEQDTPLGATVSYNNASLSLAGRIIEKVTGGTFEAAIEDLLLKPLGMQSTFFFLNDIVTRRFAVGHMSKPDGSVRVARPFTDSRGQNPAGGMVSNAADQIAWARFHLGDGTAPDGTRVLSKELLDLMKVPTVQAPGSAIGDAVGISWLLRDVEGVRLVGHGGSTIGQLSEFVTVPERDFAITMLTNCSPNGARFNEDFERWALARYLGIVREEPEPVLLGDDALAAYAGTYETIAATVEVVPEAGHLVLTVEYKPETLEQLKAMGEEIAGQPPIPLGMLPGEGDRYVVIDGPAKGMKGYFARDDQGAVGGIHVGGRLAARVTAPAASG